MESIKYHLMLGSKVILKKFFDVENTIFHYNVRNFGVCLIEVEYYLLKP
jgi:hypothetical protein